MFLLRVAVPVPGLDLLTYSVPEGMAAPAIGARVIAPLGTRLVTGVVVDLTESPPDSMPVKPIRQLLDDRPFVPAGVVDLARWTAEYYAAGPGEAILAVLPPKTRGTRADAHKTRCVAVISPAGLGVLDGHRPKGHGQKKDDATGHVPEKQDPGTRVDAAPAPAPAVTIKQRETLELVASAPRGVSIRELASSGVGSHTIARLAAGGLISLERERVERDPFQTLSFTAGPVDIGRMLTIEQEAALTRLRRLAEARTFRVALLHGVTGSGKTEIYVRLAGQICASGRQVLVLVPEIALAPAVASLFRQTFGDRVAIQHSGLSDGERHDQWQRIRRGEADVVVGTRSAVFTPLDRVGLIVVDEEHDGSYKQDESPRYHGRDVAIVRGQRSGALVVLGSATPSMESYHNAMTGRYEHLVLERRVFDRPLASVIVVDMREEFASDGPDLVLSRTLTEALRARMDRREQALVLLNRRGLATSVFCRQCAGTIECPNCSVSLVVHGSERASGHPSGHASRRERRFARCHYCNYSVRVPAVCPRCAGPYLEQAGFGTERVEAEVRRVCPAARVSRLDRDATRRKGALSTLLSRFRDGSIDVLVGTQMIAKGHDFARVTLVGVVSADVGLGLADFRASERTFQLLTQVAGRAGRGEQPGEAIVQTLYPDHYSVQLACRQAYQAFYERELQFRQAMHYPPTISLINIVVRSRTFSGAMDAAGDLAAELRAVAGRFMVLGPAPAPLERLRGEYRAQVLIKGTNRPAMREALSAAVARRPRLQRRVAVDVDPISVL